MRVLFFESNPMWIHGLPNGFRDAGHRTEVSGPLSKRRIKRWIRRFAPDLAFLLGWTDEHKSKKLRWIHRYVKRAKIPLVYWATEDPSHTEVFTLPLIEKVRPDFVFTICPELVHYYHALGIKSAHLDYGFHQSVHCPLEPIPQYKAAISVVANAYPEQLHAGSFRLHCINTLIRPLLHAGMRVDFWGKEWEKMSGHLGMDLPQEWNHGFLPYTEANKVYCSADIVLGLQNFPNQLTQRTYEILGSGGFLLTCDSPAVKRLFAPGKDLVVSDSPETTLRLVHYYLNEKPLSRRCIQEQARQSVRQYSYKRRAEYIISILQQENIISRPMA